MQLAFNLQEEVKISPHSDFNGANLVLIVAVFIAAIVLSVWMFQQLKVQNKGLDKVLQIPITRMLLGSTVIFFAVSIGRALWWPVRPMLMAENYALRDWYVDIISWPANILNMLTIAGLGILLWPMLYSRFGKYTMFVILWSMGGIYFFGAKLTEYLATVF